MSLRTKLVRTMTAMLLIVASTTLLVVAVMNYVSSQATLTTIQSHLRDNIRRKGTDLATGQALALRDLVADNAFGDVARLVERTTEQDEQIVYGLFLGEDLKPWGFASRAGRDASGSPRDWKELGIDVAGLRVKGVQSTMKYVFGQTVFEFVTAVVDDKGTYLGSLRYGISDQSLQRALEEARATSRRGLMTTVALLILLGGLATMLGALLSRRAASRITQPLSDLTKAVNALAEGHRETRVSIESGDELQLLGTAFNKMVTELQASYAQMEQMNHGLEATVAERTQALGERNRDMRLVLDNVDQGFLTLSRQGILAQERSAIVDRWFGPYGSNVAFTDYIARVDPIYAETFKLAYEALVEGVLPQALCIEQLPVKLRHDGYEFRCTYLPVGASEPPDGLLVVIDNVTSEILAERKEADRGEVLAMFEALTRDRSGLLAFIDEANEQLAKVGSADLDTQKRILHTLKGNASLVGFEVVAGMCHKLEEEIGDNQVALAEESLAALDRRWMELTKALRGFLGEKGREIVELSDRDLERLDEEIRAGAPAARILDRLASWRLEPAERALTRLGNHARALAARFGKGDLMVVIDGGGMRLSSKAWAGMWSDLVHVIRNAVDHGIEPTIVRRSAGKPPRPHMRLATFVLGRNLIFEVEDDGAGIDWPAVKRAAVRRGLPHDTEDDLVRAIFTSEITTRAQASSLSGRGMGLAAVRKQVEQLGGAISVQSTPGAGTCFRFSFLLPEIGPRFGVEALERTADPRPAVA